MVKYPISAEEQIKAFEEHDGKPLSGNAREFAALLTDTANSAYTQGFRDGLAASSARGKVTAPLPAAKEGEL